MIYAHYYQFKEEIVLNHCTMIMDNDTYHTGLNPDFYFEGVAFIVLQNSSVLP